MLFSRKIIVYIDWYFFLVNLTPYSNRADVKQLEERSQKIQLIESIGKGHYSEVYLGKWGSQSVAVKVFSATFEQYWKRESMIYSTFVLENENILQFIDSVHWSTGQIMHHFIGGEPH